MTQRNKTPSGSRVSTAKRANPKPKSPQHRAVLNLIRAVHKLSEQVQGLRKSIERPPIVVGGSLPADWRPGPVGYVDTVPAGVGAKEWPDFDAELQRAIEERISAQLREG